MLNQGFRPPGGCPFGGHRPPLRTALAALAVAAAITTAPPLAGAVSSNAPDEYRLTVTDAPPPAEVTAPIAAHVQDRSFNVLRADGEPIMDIWFARELPAPASPDPHPGVAYGTFNEGMVLAVMRLHREHHDYRDQAVGPGVYVARYLRQPDDGNHLGETAYRDFAVLVRPTTDSPGPQGFQETLDQALELNLHPFVWGLWPADQVVTTEVPGIASFQPDKWAIKLRLSRADGSNVTVAFVVAGNEWHY